ncbi:RNA polymerase sigma factor [Niabella beijingensis]|uniref:RNA polymerase sigma factor n=1 Tax=Niabella beijingensis TaxID=2872700 RepID=UPI001CBFDE32|nr:sigma-70 family RNA polymerase sigma factor [Niabella beijingensis]MBZ4188158.1 sigma-70 family RNA polymerase sigma factor [Niabella beijingensis]
MDHTIEIARDEQVELCRKGDTSAYFAIYERYAKPMLNSSMRIVNNIADAEDMVQEAFIDAFNNLESFTYKSSFEAWLRRIVINKSISLLRKRKITWAVVDLSGTAAEESGETNEEQFEFDVQRIRTAIRTLPENYRIIFNLFVIDELKQDEIAALLNISHNNVRTIYHRAKKKVLDILKSDDNEQ